VHVEHYTGRHTAAACSSPVLQLFGLASCSSDLGPAFQLQCQLDMLVSKDQAALQGMQLETLCLGMVNQASP
jgi:hypothetical protein